MSTKDSNEIPNLETIDPLLTYLVSFGKKHDLRRTKVQLGELVLEIEFSEPNLVTSKTFLQSGTHTELNTTQGATQPIEENPNVKTIKSPLVGTYYLAPSPNADPFISVGDFIKKGQVIGIIEAMKLFNEVESEYSGKVIQIIAKNETPVEYNQPLVILSLE